MLDSIASNSDEIYPRKFQVFFCCRDCFEVAEVQAETIYIKPWSGKNDIDGYLARFVPFCCERCGWDDFYIQSWNELK